MPKYMPAGLFNTVVTFSVISYQPVTSEEDPKAFALGQSKEVISTFKRRVKLERAEQLAEEIGVRRSQRIVVIKDSQTRTVEAGRDTVEYDGDTYNIEEVYPGEEYLEIELQSVRRKD